VRGVLLMSLKSPAQLLDVVLPAGLALVAAAALGLWVSVGADRPIERRVAGMDFEQTGAGTSALKPPPGPESVPPNPGEPLPGPGRPADLAAGWPWFRGPEHDAIDHDSPRLARSWPADGPRLLWQIELGQGYAAAAVAGGRVYVLDHVRDRGAEVLRSLRFSDRRALGAALATALAATPRQSDTELVEDVLSRLFALEGSAPDDARPRLAPADKAELKQLLATWLADDPKLLLAALEHGWIDLVDRSADVARCLSLEDGMEIWSNSYRVLVPPNHGMSRTVPSVVDDCVITLGPKCDVVCWDAETGRARWVIDLVLEYGAEVPAWYAGQCPLIDEVTDRLILAPGGKALLMAVDYRTGEVVWESANPRGWVMTHSSIVPMELAGRRMYVYCAREGVVGVDAADGTILWDTTDWRISMATCPSPVPLGDGRVFFCGGYNAGALLLKIAPGAEGFRADTLRRFGPREFSSEQQTPVLYEGHLYGVRQSDKRLVCLDLQGNEVWNSGRDKFGAAPYMIADNVLLVMDDRGRLTMAEATPEAWRPLAHAQIFEEGVDSWGPMALVDGRLIVRDFTRIST